MQKHWLKVAKNVLREKVLAALLKVFVQRQHREPMRQMQQAAGHTSDDQLRYGEGVTNPSNNPVANQQNWGGSQAMP